MEVSKFLVIKIFYLYDTQVNSKFPFVTAGLHIFSSFIRVLFMGFGGCLHKEMK